MKKTLSVAAVMAVLGTPAFALTGNMENPLFMPTNGQVYSKTTIGLMYKKVDSSLSQILRNHDGHDEFPIWRPMEELGVGITDNWMVHGVVGYTYNPDIDRQGFHLGRIGTTYRVIESDDGYVWDLYGDFHLGGMEKMKGSLVKTADIDHPVTFDYDNFSNGRWGYHVGTKFGKKWSRFSASIFAELLRSWGNHNNEIDVSALGMGVYGMPDKISVDIGSTTEVNAGANAFYQFDDRWSAGLGLRYNYHASNTLRQVHTDLSSLPTELQMEVNGLVSGFKDMRDKFNEYIFNFTLARQMTDYLQIAWYFEDTYDNGAHLSSNTTDLKIESGFRFNLKF